MISKKMNKQSEEIGIMKEKYTKLKQEHEQTKRNYETELQKCVIEMEQLRVIVQTVIQNQQEKPSNKEMTTPKANVQKGSGRKEQKDNSPFLTTNQSETAVEQNATPTSQLKIQVHSSTGESPFGSPKRKAIQSTRVQSKVKKTMTKSFNENKV